jgi:hypothetical protein
MVVAARTGAPYSPPRDISSNYADNLTLLSNDGSPVRQKALARLAASSD